MTRFGLVGLVEAQVHAGGGRLAVAGAGDQVEQGIEAARGQRLQHRAGGVLDRAGGQRRAFGLPVAVIPGRVG
ncbi:MAG: hypothetical protein L0K86_25985, partial [Actinomycetia bacterium]|nr:hypothetical protein [Actinomycetes bacterium]